MDKSHPKTPPWINTHLLLDRATRQTRGIKSPHRLLIMLPDPTGDDLAVYFKPGGLANLEVRSSIVRAQNVMRTSGRSNALVVARTQVGQGTPYSQGLLDCSTEDNQGGIVLSHTVATGPVGRGTAHHPHHDTVGDGLGKGYSQDSKMGNDEDSFGHEAISTSPLFSDKSIPGRCGHDTALG
jgi:hypothetical protein